MTSRPASSGTAGGTARNAPCRISDITLDSHSAVTRNADLEIERQKAVTDLLDTNTFRLKDPAEAEGPYRVTLSMPDDRMILQARCLKTGTQQDIRIPLTALKRHFADYAILCDNFYKTARAGQIHKLETIDAGRRSIHNEAAEILEESIAATAETDHATARRLFTLLYVLHMRGVSTLIP